jgi:hypothetical protein
MQLTLFTFLFLTNARRRCPVMTGWLHSVARINPSPTSCVWLAGLARRGDVGEHVGWTRRHRRDECDDADLRLPATSQTLGIGIDNERFHRDTFIHD